VKAGHHRGSQGQAFLLLLHMIHIIAGGTCDRREHDSNDARYSKRSRGETDLWLPAHGPSHATVDAMAGFGWIVATLTGDRVHIQLTNAGRAALAGTA
jgi:hypothetical protein